MNFATRSAHIALLGMLLVGTVILDASAESRVGAPPTESEILDALRSRPRTRGLGEAAGPRILTTEERGFVEGLRTRSARSLTILERQKVADIIRERPSIDLEIQFDYNSAVVGPQAVPTLLKLGRVLSSDELKGMVFLINGHTDGKGNDGYNQDLSERRAEAVKRLLIDQFNLPVSTLVAVGYGKTRLKNTADPLASENRRVQIVNTEIK
jgi:outer membrane protein OmpA-like peptidoglycan-associated protein